MSGQRVLLIGLLLLSGCSTRFDRADTATPPGDPLTYYDTQIVVGPCAFSEPPPPSAKAAPIVAAIGAAIISQAVGTVGTTLSDSAKEKTWESPAYRNIVTNQSLASGCLQIARGFFHVGFRTAEERAGKLDAAKKSATITGTEVTSARIEQLWDRKMWLASSPDFLFEGRFLPAPDAKIMTLAPGYVWFGVPAGARMFRLDRSRKVAVHIAFPSSSDVPSVKPLAAGYLSLGRLQPGTELLYPYPDYNTDTDPNRGPTESRLFVLSLDGSKSTIMTVAATVTEHEDEDAFLAFLGGAISGAKGDLSSALQGSLLPSKIELAEEAEKKLDEAFQKALDDLRAATIGCTTNEIKDAALVAATVREKIRAAEAAARASGDDSELQKANVKATDITIQSSVGTLRSECGSLAQKLAKIK